MENVELIFKGPWQKVTIAERDGQLNNIAVKVETYKTILGISAPDITRITKANEMAQYIATSRTSLIGYVEGLTKYKDQLLDGNVLQSMNAFPALPDLGTAPDAGLAGIWGFIEKRRTVWMAADAFTETIGDDMQIIGPTVIINTNNYKPLLTAKVGAGVIHVKTDSAYIEVHNLYAANAGEAFELIASFKGSKFEYKRVIKSGVAESVILQVQGVYKNNAIGMLSDIVTVAYNG